MVHLAQRLFVLFMHGLARKHFAPVKCRAPVLSWHAQIVDFVIDLTVWGVWPKSMYRKMRRERAHDQVA